MTLKQVVVTSASFLAILAVATVNASVCEQLNDICVPSQDIRENCQCVLTNAELANEDKALLVNKLLGYSNQLDDIRYEYLPRKAVSALKSFFTTSATIHELNRNIFKDVKYRIYVELMIVEQSKAHHLFNLLNTNHLSAAVKNHISHCPSGHCEQRGTLEDDHKNTWNKRTRTFNSEMAMRMDFANKTMVAFATAKSECILEHMLQEYQEKVCKIEWVFWKKCWNETKFA
uniref:Uncharacterized protein n=1 Tax=Plectus sambesii TaxID=2011161 RepID=A0A914XAJ5_9BILA